MVSFIWYMAALMCVVAAAVLGMDFSPSFTAMFLVAFLVLTALGELCGYLERKKGCRVFTALGHLLPAAGALLVLVSTYMYANGDDWLGICIWAAPLAAVMLHSVIYLAFYRKQHREMGIGAGIENCLLLAAGLFTFACAIPSTALWTYGMGVLLILTARRLGEVKADSWLSRGVMILGMSLCAVFLGAPMVF